MHLLYAGIAPSASLDQFIETSGSATSIKFPYSSITLYYPIVVRGFNRSYQLLSCHDIIDIDVLVRVNWLLVWSVFRKRNTVSVEPVALLSMGRENRVYQLDLPFKFCSFPSITTTGLIWASSLMLPSAAAAASGSSSTAFEAMSFKYCTCIPSHSL